MEHVRNYINGKWMDAKSGETFQSINPAHQEEVVGIVSKSGRQDVDDAVKAAIEAYGGGRQASPGRKGLSRGQLR
jgi:aldehyde dehydrogenase (NAD+)